MPFFQPDPSLLLELKVSRGFWNEQRHNIGMIQFTGNGHLLFSVSLRERSPQCPLFFILDFLGRDLRLFPFSPVGKWLHASGWSHGSIQLGIPGVCSLGHLCPMAKSFPGAEAKLSRSLMHQAWKSSQINRHDPGIKFSLDHCDAEFVSGRGKPTETKPFGIHLIQIKRKSDRDKIATVPPSLDKLLLDPHNGFFLLSPFLSHSLPSLPPPSLLPSSFLHFSLLAPFLGCNIPVQLFI